MRAGTVLAGMLVAAVAAFLIWFDATGQLRPFLSTAPMVVFELDPPAPIPDPQIASIPEPAEAAPAEPASGATIDRTDDAAVEPDATTGDAAAGSGVTIADAVSAALEAAGETASDTDSIAAEASANSAADVATGSAADVAADIATGIATDAPADPASADPASSDTAMLDATTESESAAVDAARTMAASDPAGDGSSAPPPSKPDEAAAPDTIAPGNVTADTPASNAATPDAATQTAALPTMPSGAELPWRLYASEFPVSDPRPRIAIVFTSLGLSDAAGDAIIANMPPGVTLAFSPYSRKLTDWIERAREDGHEVLIELPMEPLNYPDDDPGPLALLSTLPVQDNITRMDGILARADGVVGVAVHMGSRFTTSSELMRPILEALGERGYLYVDNGAAPFSVLPTLSQEIAVPMAINNHYIDREASRIAIDGRLQQIERIARSEGAAVAFASPYPITIERLAAWIPTLEAKGFVLAPITAVVGRQPLQ
ncbi:MAG: divergent polysaccharide deacetylase family protein [Rhodospirillaceae bacterium]|nr:divergent polysaccharide deacetylase family protein [Rhodospirillaceae bacterium]